MSGLVGVILAGGRGRRMGALGDEFPKALLPVANLPLAAHHLRLLHGLGVRTVHVVLGHRGAEVAAALGDGSAHGVRIRYAEQGAPLGSAHALGCLRPHLVGPFLLTLGDYFFVAPHAARLVRRLESGASAIAAMREPDPRLLREACALEVDGEGRVLDVVEKPAAPRSDLKGCGFYALQPEVLDAVARTPRTALRDEYELTVSLELYVRAGGALYAEEVFDWDVNLTRPDDLLHCNLRWLAQERRNELVADDAEVGAGARLERAVVGGGARVAGAARLRESVVFPGARVDAGRPLRRVLVTPRHTIPCSVGPAAPRAFGRTGWSGPLSP
ncbi:MAG: nucleotidyltransferase family protein [Longimicrobiaceae bacterium]